MRKHVPLETRPHYWVVVDHHGHLLLQSISQVERKAKSRFLELHDRARPWKDYQAKGFSIRRIEIKEAK